MGGSPSHVAPRTNDTAGSLRLWNHALARMMIVCWANDLIAPFAVSQCLCVPDPSDGVGVKGELPAELAILLFVRRRLNKNTGPKGPTVSTAKAAEPPSFVLNPPAVPAS